MGESDGEIRQRGLHLVGRWTKAHQTEVGAELDAANCAQQIPTHLLIQFEGLRAIAKGFNVQSDCREVFLILLGNQRLWILTEQGKPMRLAWHQHFEWTVTALRHTAASLEVAWVQKTYSRRLPALE